PGRIPQAGARFRAHRATDVIAAWSRSASAAGTTPESPRHRSGAVTGTTRRSDRASTPRRLAGDDRQVVGGNVVLLQPPGRLDDRGRLMLGEMPGRERPELGLDVGVAQRVVRVAGRYADELLQRRPTGQGHPHRRG